MSERPQFVWQLETSPITSRGHSFCSAKAAEGERPHEAKEVVGAISMNWKTDYRSIYYLGAPEPGDLDLKWSETALLVIDVQNVYRTRPPREDRKSVV